MRRSGVFWDSSVIGASVFRFSTSFGPGISYCSHLPVAAGPGCLAAGSIRPAAVATRIHVLSLKRGADHRPGTSDTALHRDCLDRAVPGTGPAFHAGLRAD